MRVCLVRANRNDTEEIWRIQREAFAELLERYQDMDTNPGNEPLEKIIMRMEQPFTHYYFIQVEQLHGGSGWELDTILQEKGNCHLYEKMGYHTTGKTEVINERLMLVFYEK